MHKFLKSSFFRDTSGISNTGNHSNLRIHTEQKSKAPAGKTG